MCPVITDSLKLLMKARSYIQFVKKDFVKYTRDKNIVLFG